MATVTFEVSTYDVELGRWLDSGSDCRLNAVITCHGQGGEQLLLYFVDPESPMPENSYNPSTGIGMVFLPAEQYPWYVDILRNEGPVFARMDSEKPLWNKLFTGAEPVGEGEEYQHGERNYA